MTTVLGHWLQGIIKDMSMDLAALSSNKYRALPLLAKMIGLISTFVMPILLFPQLVTYMFALPLLASGLFYLANPINQIIRPLSAYFNVAPIFVGGVTAILGVGALAAFLLLSSSMIEVFLALASVVSILSFIASALVLKKLYELSRR